MSSLDVLAVAAADALAATGSQEPFPATLDARRKELFWASYDATGSRPPTCQVDRPGDIPHGLVVGAGPVALPRRVRPGAGARRRPTPACLAQVVAEDRRAELVDAEPIYLRRPDAAVPGPPKKVS